MMLIELFSNENLYNNFGFLSRQSEDSSIWSFPFCIISLRYLN